jgi:hypothetical protein
MSPVKMEAMVDQADKQALVVGKVEMALRHILAVKGQEEEVLEIMEVELCVVPHTEHFLAVQILLQSMETFS